MRFYSSATDQEGFCCSTDAGASHLCAHSDLRGHADVCILIDVHVAIAIQMPDDGHAGFFLTPLDEALAAAGNDDVYVVCHARQHVADGCAIGGGNNLNASLRQARFAKA